MITPKEYILNGKYFGATLLYGTSSDSKPTTYGNGSMFVEIDTGKIFRYNSASSEWVYVANELDNRVNALETATTPIYKDIDIAGKTVKAELVIIGNLAILTSTGDFASVDAGTTDLADLSDYIPRKATFSTLPNTQLTGQSYVRINHLGIVQLYAANARASTTTGSFQLIWVF